MSNGKRRAGFRSGELTERILPPLGCGAIVLTATNWFTAETPYTPADDATLWGMVPHQSAAAMAGIFVVLAGLAGLAFAAHRSTIAVAGLSALAVFAITNIMPIADNQGYAMADGVWLTLVFCLLMIALTVLPFLIRLNARISEGGQKPPPAAAD